MITKVDINSITEKWIIHNNKQYWKDFSTGPFDYFLIFLCNVFPQIAMPESSVIRLKRQLRICKELIFTAPNVLESEGDVLESEGDGIRR